MNGMQKWPGVYKETQMEEKKKKKVQVYNVIMIIIGDLGCGKEICMIVSTPEECLEVLLCLLDSIRWAVEEGRTSTIHGVDGVVAEKSPPALNDVLGYSLDAPRQVANQHAGVQHVHKVGRRQVIQFCNNNNNKKNIFSKTTKINASH